MTVKGSVLIKADEEDLPNIVARITEFQADGVLIDKAYSMADARPESIANVIAFVVARSREIFEEFVEIIKGYAGIKSVRAYPSTA